MANALASPPGFPLTIGAISLADLESSVLDTPSVQDDASHHHHWVMPERKQESATQAVASQGGDDALYAPLTIKNYKTKFGKLIGAERKFHEGILRERY